LGRHRNVVQLKDYAYSLDEALLMYFDFYVGGDLAGWMGRVDFVWEACMWDPFLQLLDAIAYLHYGYDRKARYPDEPHRDWRSMVHADTKPETVFLKLPLPEHEYPEIVVGDFGSATLRSVTNGPMTTAPCYQGPEIYREMTAKSDVGTIGVIIHELAHDKAPIGPKTSGISKYDWLSKPRARDPQRRSKDLVRLVLNDRLL